MVHENIARLGIILILIPFQVSGTQYMEVDSTAVFNGEIAVFVEENVDTVKGVKALFTVKASREEIWNMLNDYERYKEIYGGIDGLNILSRDTNGITIEFWSNVLLFWKINFILKRTFDRKFHTISWVNAGGDFDYIRGGWKILDTPHPDDKLLVYESYVQINNQLIKDSYIKKVKKKVVKMAEGIRAWMDQNQSLYSN